MRDPIPLNRNLTDQITDAPAEGAAAGQQLTERANDVFRATSLIVLETVDQRLEAIVYAQAEHTTQLGKSGVDKLRAALAAVKAKLPGESAKRLVTAFSWTFPQEAAWIGEGDK